MSEVSGQDFKGLKNELSDESSSDDVLELLSQKFSDPTIKNLALDYLITTSPPDGKLRAALIQAKQTLFQQNPQAIVGGRNVLIASEAFASKAHTSPSSLRSLYLQVTSGPSNCSTLRQMLSSYSPSEKTVVLDFLVGGMVADLKSGGPSIPPAQLQVYMTELSNLQALNSVDNFFDKHTGGILNNLKNEGFSPPPSVTPKNLAQTFFKLVEDKFPSSMKTQKLLSELVGQETTVQTEVLNLFFRALSGCSPRIFLGAEKKQQLGTIITNTLDAVNADNEDYPKPGDFPRAPIFPQPHATAQSILSESSSPPAAQ